MTSYLPGSWFVLELVTLSGGGTYSLLAGTAPAWKLAQISNAAR